MENAGAGPFREAEAMHRTEHGGLGGFDRVVLVMRRRGRTSEVENLIHLEHERLCDVVSNQLKMRIIDQMQHIALPAGKIIIHANDIVAVFDETIAEMGAEESGTAGN